MQPRTTDGRYTFAPLERPPAGEGSLEWDIPPDLTTADEVLVWADQVEVPAWAARNIADFFPESRQQCLDRATQGKWNLQHDNWLQENPEPQVSPKTADEEWQEQREARFRQIWGSESVWKARKLMEKWERWHHRPTGGQTEWSAWLDGKHQARMVAVDAASANRDTTGWRAVSEAEEQWDAGNPVPVTESTRHERWQAARDQAFARINVEVPREADEWVLKRMTAETAVTAAKIMWVNRLAATLPEDEKQRLMSTEIVTPWTTYRTPGTALTGMGIRFIPTECLSQREYREWIETQRLRAKVDRLEGELEQVRRVAAEASSDVDRLATATGQYIDERERAIRRDAGRAVAATNIIQELRRP
jgi:hypothetical protein